MKNQILNLQSIIILKIKINPNSKSNLNLNKTIKEINVDDEQLRFKN